MSPVLIRKLNILAAADGLVLHHTSPHHQAHGSNHNNSNNNDKNSNYSNSSGRRHGVYTTTTTITTTTKGHNHDGNNGSGGGSGINTGESLSSSSFIIRIEYESNKISSEQVINGDVGDGDGDYKNGEGNIVGLEAYGLVGLLSVSSSCSFLVPITQRKQVAQIHGSPVYAVTDVALIPTSSRDDAVRAISQVKDGLLQGDGGVVDTASEEKEDGDDDEDEYEYEDNDQDDISDAGTSGTDISSSAAEIPAGETGTGTVGSRETGVGGIAEDVIGKKVRFGRFAASWLSKKALGLSGLSALGAQGAGILSGNPNAKESLATSTSTSTSTTKTNTKSGADSTDSDAQKGGDEDASVTISEAVPGGSLPQGEAGQGKGEGGGSPPPLSDETVELLPKLLRYTKMIFASQNFFFAYDYDLTRAIGSSDKQNCHMPLHKAVDPVYFWNRHLMGPFIEAGAHCLVLPLMQGFVGQKEFSVAVPKQQFTETGGNDGEGSPSLEEKSHILDEKDEPEATQPGARKRTFLLTLISRRSVKRPGLRYLRRGIDDDGNTANTVETEQVLSAPDWNPAQRIYSFLQIRGSIPVYFSQSPYAFKPVPVLQHSTETNKLAFERHFRELGKRYGKVQAVSLIDKQGGELNLGQQYEKYAERLNESGGINGSLLHVEWFDFHNECQGMKFENVRKLVVALEKVLDGYGDTVMHSNAVLRRQTGVVRTNCMDCLDRTGVAQCAFGQRALERELQHEGISINLQDDLSTQWFNILWADNGDAISKQYSSTAALKGDYTRTRKRNYRGAINDLGLTLSRYFNNAVNDFFSQACIDYLLGNVSTHVFEEFEQELQSADPGISVNKLRQNAIDTSCQIVISEQSEEFLGGWTMLTPRKPNTLRSHPLEESVLLLTDTAVYSCRFDWSTDKVISFERVDLRSITRINYGTYITSILTEAQMDRKTNVGLVIVHSDDDENSLRVNTRSLQSSVNLRALDNGGGGAGTSSWKVSDKNNNNNNDGHNEWDIYSWIKGTSASERSEIDSPFIAFKALPLSNSATKNKNNEERNGGVPSNVTELDFVRCICEEIERAIKMATRAAGTDHDDSVFLQETDIISLEDAKRRTGYLEHLFYDIKKMVWA